MPLQDAHPGFFQGALDHRFVAARDVVRHGARADSGEAVDPRRFFLQLLDDSGFGREGVVAVGAGDAHAQVRTAVAPQHLVLFEQYGVASLSSGLDGGAVAGNAGADYQRVALVYFGDVGVGS